MKRLSILLALVFTSPALAVDIEHARVLGDIPRQNADAVVETIRRSGFQCDSLSFISYGNVLWPHYSISCNDYTLDYDVIDHGRRGTWGVCQGWDYAECSAQMQLGMVPRF